ncbi:hypothetical protein FACS189461_3840 [Spirochaetia bacterium]|nr:hypothetical protein FACS189461_3840 [Spirochaetia bacterium]
MPELFSRPKEVNNSENTLEYSPFTAELAKGTDIEDIYSISDSEKPKWDNANYELNKEIKLECVSIRDAYGDTIANTIDDIVEGPDKEIQTLWKKYKEEVLVGEPDYDEYEAWYDPDAGTVTININDCRAGRNYEPPYQVAFHEFGHNIDHKINVKINGDSSALYSELYKDGLLGKTAKAEASEFIENYRLKMEETEGRSVSLDDACARISDELTENIPLTERGDLSDIFEGATDGKINLGVGHGKDYWKDHDNGTEIFAEIFSASICNKGSLTEIKEYFPETYKVFQEIVRSANGNA